MHILDMDSTGILEINYDYLEDLFAEDEIKYLHTRIITMIENLIKDADVSVDDVNIISEAEKESKGLVQRQY